MQEGNWGTVKCNLSQMQGTQKYWLKYKWWCYNVSYMVVNNPLEKHMKIYVRVVIFHHTGEKKILWQNELSCYCLHIFSTSGFPMVYLKADFECENHAGFLSSF